MPFLGPGPIVDTKSHVNIAHPAIRVDHHAAGDLIGLQTKFRHLLKPLHRFSREIAEPSTAKYSGKCDIVGLNSFFQHLTHKGLDAIPITGLSEDFEGDVEEDHIPFPFQVSVEPAQDGDGSVRVFHVIEKKNRIQLRQGVGKRGKEAGNIAWGRFQGDRDTDKPSVAAVGVVTAKGIDAGAVRIDPDGFPGGL
ncbi:hypothetical protein HPP92_007601 [Vanilla planifolia]|uniref:Uncharacterized protein n=1 Tax=Vanilla planifolia TaxID=51239 RepID=A0A835RHV2_VANPL|nr:hypothetical protein HPP92_007601 [Vanilla planifolia]